MDDTDRESQMVGGQTEPAPTAPAPPDGAEKPNPLVGLARRFGRQVGTSGAGIAILGTVIVIFVGAAAYVSWWLFLPWTVAWANLEPWRWTFAWFLVMVGACVPAWCIMGGIPLMSGALGEFIDRKENKEKRVLDELTELEQQIKGSKEPVDYARYGRKALQAYYYMGQSQVRVSFYIGVAAMIFGFVFLLAGLAVQVLDVSKIPYLRANPNVDVVAIGGGLIIEFVAATFLWMYRAAIVQLNRYYRRQMLTHSALISVAISSTMPEGKDAALRSIVDRMIAPDAEEPLPKMFKRRAAAAGVLKPAT